MANASAAAALDLVDSETSSGPALHERLEEVLIALFGARRMAKEFEVIGRSGKRYSFDFAIRRRKESWLLIEGVSPHPSSIAAKYVAFSDTRSEGDALEGRYAAYDRPLEDADAALMQQVAALIPFAHVARGLRAEAEL